MPKKRLMIALLVVGVLGISGYSIFQGNDQTVQADQTDEKQDDVGIKEDTKETESVVNVQAKAKLNKLTDEEIIELIKKSEDNNYQITEDFTEEEASILKELSGEQYYDLMGMTDDEVLGYLDGYHLNINRMIRNIDKGKEDENGRLVGTVEFEWIKDNYKFENEIHNESINEILELIDEYNTEGNQDILFSLKYILYELNQEYNPESLNSDFASELSILDAVRIQNGKEPLKEVIQ